MKIHFRHEHLFVSKVTEMYYSKMFKWYEACLTSIYIFLLSILLFFSLSLPVCLKAFLFYVLLARLHRLSP